MAIGYPDGQRGEIEKLQERIRQYRETTYTGYLVWGILLTSIGGLGALYCVIFLLTLSGVRGFSEIDRMKGWCVFGLIVSVVLLIVGITLIRSFADARSNRNTQIDYLKDELENLYRSGGTSQQSSGSAPTRRTYTSPVKLSGGSWRCVCGRVNASYVGTCACGRTKNGTDPSAEAEKKRREEKEAEQKRQQEAEKSRIQQETAKKEQDIVRQEQQSWQLKFAALRELKSLLDDGIVTQEEFESQKKILLGDEPAAAPAAAEAIVPVAEEAVPAENVTLEQTDADLYADADLYTDAPAVTDFSSEQTVVLTEPPFRTDDPDTDRSLPEPAPEPAPPLIRYCMKCGRPYGPEAKFCAGCGNRLNE